MFIIIFGIYHVIINFRFKLGFVLAMNERLGLSSAITSLALNLEFGISYDAQWLVQCFKGIAYVRLREPFKAVHVHREPRVPSFFSLLRKLAN